MTSGTRTCRATGIRTTTVVCTDVPEASRASSLVLGCSSGPPTTAWPCRTASGSASRKWGATWLGTAGLPDLSGLSLRPGPPTAPRGDAENPCPTLDPERRKRRGDHRVRNVVFASLAACLLAVAAVLAGRVTIAGATATDAAPSANVALVPGFHAPKYSDTESLP